MAGRIEHFDGVQIGLTATPCAATVDDDAPDEEDTAYVRGTLRFFEVDKPTFSYKLKDAIREAYLVPYQIYKAETVITAAEGGFPVRRAELDWTAMEPETKTELEKLFEAEGDSITVDPVSTRNSFPGTCQHKAIWHRFEFSTVRGAQARLKCAESLYI
jgi:type I restriction enzyme, R subunit